MWWGFSCILLSVYLLHPQHRCRNQSVLRSHIFHILLLESCWWYSLKLCFQGDEPLISPIMVFLYGSKVTLEGRMLIRGEEIMGSAVSMAMLPWKQQGCLDPVRWMRTSHGGGERERKQRGGVRDSLGTWMWRDVSGALLYTKNPHIVVSSTEFTYAFGRTWSEVDHEVWVISGVWV